MWWEVGEIATEEHPINGRYYCESLAQLFPPFPIPLAAAFSTSPFPHPRAHSLRVQAIFSPEGKLLLGCSAGFKKITQVGGWKWLDPQPQIAPSPLAPLPPQVKANLSIVANHPEAKRFVLDPQGIAEPA